MRRDRRPRSTGPDRDRPATALTSVPAVVPAAVAVGGRRAEAVALLGLRILRATSVALIVLGAVVAIATGHFDEVELRDLTTAPGMVRAVFSPLALLAVGVALRLLLAPVAWLIAFVVVVDGRLDVRAQPDTRWLGSRVLDRFRVATAIQSLRWTTAAKRDAAGRLGRLGAGLVAAEWAARGVSALGVVAGFLVAAAQS